MLDVAAQSERIKGTLLRSGLLPVVCSFASQPEQLDPSLSVCCCMRRHSRRPGMRSRTCWTGQWRASASWAAWPCCDSTAPAMQLESAILSPSPGAAVQAQQEARHAFKDVLDRAAESARIKGSLAELHETRTLSLLQDIMGELKPSSTLSSTLQAQQEAGHAFKDVLDRAAESERIKGSLAMLRQYDSLFRLPARIRTATAQGEFQQVSQRGVLCSRLATMHASAAGSRRDPGASCSAACQQRAACARTESCDVCSVNVC